MSFVVTLISGPRARALDNRALERAQHAVSTDTGPVWLAPGIAADIAFTAPDGNLRSHTEAIRAALGSAWLGGYHAGVEWGFWKGPTDCTGPVGNLGSAGNLLARLDTVKVIRCDEIQWTFLGLSLAGYNALISLLMAAIAAWGIVRTTKQA